MSFVSHPLHHPILTIMVLITAEDYRMTKLGGQTETILRRPSLSLTKWDFFFFLTPFNDVTRLRFLWDFIKMFVTEPM